MSLPRFIVLKSNDNNKFLCYAKEKGPTHAFLRFSQEFRPQKDAAEFLESERKDDADADADADVEFHFLKFKVEEAKTAQGFVHIRTCYNNKYWVRKSVDCKTIVAEANEPEEDQSKWSCTLFKPMVLGAADDDDTDYFVPPVNGDKPQKIQLLHVTQLEQHYVKEGAVDDSLEDGSASSTDHSAVTFTAYNVTVTARLPQYVTFIGHDGRYISNFRGNDLGFITTDIGAEGVAMEVKGGPFPPYIVLYVRDSNRWWLLNPNSDIGLNPGGTNTSFGPVQVGGHIAIHVRANGNFVHRVTTSYDGTGARIATITEAALLRVGEPVRSREILSADYNLADSRIYDTSSVEKFVDSRTNNTSIEQTGTFQVEYKSSHTTSWNQSLTVHMGIAVSWSVGIPYVGEFGLDISYERTEVSEWGEEKTEEKTVTFTQNITIPPRKRVTMRVMAMRSMCDVPFTCVVRDVMTNGVTRQYTKTDGLFTGSNEYSFHTVIDEQDV